MSKGQLCTPEKKNKIKMNPINGTKDIPIAKAKQSKAKEQHIIVGYTNYNDSQQRFVLQELILLCQYVHLQKG